jgi:hypothetical protein
MYNNLSEYLKGSDGIKMGGRWVHLAQAGNQRRALVNTVMELRVAYRTGNSFTGSITQCCIMKCDLGQD